MAETITASETVYTEVRGSRVRWRFRYTLSGGSKHDRIAWVAASTDEATERAFRGDLLLEELAEAEAATIIGGG